MLTGMMAVQPAPGSSKRRPRPALGYAFAVAAAVISGISIYVNSLGVHLYRDATLYTTLKNGVVGAILLVPLLFLGERRREYGRLQKPTAAWLVALAVTGGSVPYLLFFNGLQHSTAVTAAFLNHLQFLLVGLLAVAFLGERIRPAMWAGFAVLLVGATLGLNFGQLRWSSGAGMILSSTFLFAVDFVIAKHLLRGLSTLAVMTAKMTLGSAILVLYSGLTGHLAGLLRLSGTQVEFVLLVGLVLLAFTVFTFLAIRHAMVSAVIAIGMASPLVTTVLQYGVSHRLHIAPADAAGLLVTLAAVVAILIMGIRQEAARRPRPAPAQAT